MKINTLSATVNGTMFVLGSNLDDADPRVARILELAKGSGATIVSIDLPATPEVAEIVRELAGRDLP